MTASEKYLSILGVGLWDSAGASECVQVVDRSRFNMAQLVEGDWRQFHVKFIKKEDYPAVLQHLRENFHRDEPLCKIVGSDDHYFRDVDRVTVPILEQGLSIAVVEKSTGKIAGVRVTERRNKNDIPLFSEGFSEKLATVFGFLAAADKIVDVFQRYQVEEYAHFVMASVGREFRGKGLATEMYRRILPCLQEKGFKLVKSSLTSPYTQRIAEKFGFEDVAKKYFRDLENTEGRLLCPDLNDDQFVAVKVLRFFND